MSRSRDVVGTFSISSILGLIPGRHDSYHIGLLFFSSECMQKNFKQQILRGSGERWGTPVTIKGNKKIGRVHAVSRNFGIARVLFSEVLPSHTQCDSGEMVQDGPQIFASFSICYVKKL